MTISDRTRKILWSRAHDRCALCRTALTRDRPDGSVDVVGVEGHIVARSIEGPRGRSVRATDIDAYDNLLLVCPNDHQRIDQDPDWYTVDRLRDIKLAHESWAASHYDPAPGGTPSPPEHLVELHEAQRGEDIWHVVVGAGAYYLENEVPVEDENRADRAAQFVQVVFEYGEMSSDIQGIGPKAEHDAAQQLTSELRGIQADGLAIWTGRTTAAIGSAKDPVHVPAAVVLVRPNAIEAETQP